MKTRHLILRAKAPTSDGRAPERYLWTDDQGWERVLDLVHGVLYPPAPPGSSQRHGYWVPVSDAERGDRRLLDSLEHASEGLEAEGERGPRQTPDQGDLGGLVWTKGLHPASLDGPKPTAKRLLSALRAERDGFPLTILLHARRCAESLPFADTVHDLGLLDPSDDLWVVPSPRSTKKVDLDLGVPWLLVEKDDPQGQALYHEGLLDVVLLTGDETSATLPADRFVGRTSAIVIESIGPRSGEFVTWYRSTDALVFLSYPWPPRSSAARTLWQAFRQPPDTTSLAKCLRHIANESPEEELRYVSKTLAAALIDRPKEQAELLAEFERLTSKPVADVLRAAFKDAA